MLEVQSPTKLVPEAAEEVHPERAARPAILTPHRCIFTPPRRLDLPLLPKGPNPCRLPGRLVPDRLTPCPPETMRGGAVTAISVATILWPRAPLLADTAEGHQPPQQCYPGFTGASPHGTQKRMLASQLWGPPRRSGEAFHHWARKVALMLQALWRPYRLYRHHLHS